MQRNATKEKKNAKKTLQITNTKYYIYVRRQIKRFSNDPR